MSGSRVLLVTLRLALAVTILAFVPGLFEQFEAPKAEAVRVCGLGSLALAVGSGRREWHGWRLMDWAVGLWLGVELLATATSVAPTISLLGSTVQREGLLTSLGLSGLYAAARCSSGEFRAACRSLDVLVAAACLAALYGLAQAAGLDPFPWHGAAEYGSATFFRRPFGTLGHPNLMAIVTGSALPIALFRAWASPSGQLKWVIAGVTLALATLVSLSRAAWLGSLAGTMVAVLLLARSGSTGFPLRRILPAAGLAILGLLVALVALRAPLVTRLGELLSTGGSGAARFEIWRSALAAAGARPILGHGPDTFELIYPRYQTPGYWRIEWGLQPFHAHSIVLHTLATRGIAGLFAGLVWVAGLVLALGAAWRAGGEARGLVPPLAGVLVALGVSGGFGALGMSGALVVVFVSGTLAGVVGPAAPRTDRAGRAPLVSGLAVALVTLAWALVELSAAWSAGEAREVLDVSPARAAAAATRAARLAPWEDSYARMRAESLERVALEAPDRAQVLAEAAGAARRAVTLAPLRALNYRRLGSVLAGPVMPGDSVGGAPAEAAFRRAVALAPADGISWMELARLELYLGRPQAALAPARQVLTLYPTEAQAHTLLAQALRGVGDRVGAQAELERAAPGSPHFP